jgi:hypothetical protein
MSTEKGKSSESSSSSRKRYVYLDKYLKYQDEILANFNRLGNRLKATESSIWRIRIISLIAIAVATTALIIALY